MSTEGTPNARTVDVESVEKIIRAQFDSNDTTVALIHAATEIIACENPQSDPDYDDQRALMIAARKFLRDHFARKSPTLDALPKF